MIANLHWPHCTLFSTYGATSVFTYHLFSLHQITTFCSSWTVAQGPFVLELNSRTDLSCCIRKYLSPSCTWPDQLMELAVDEPPTINSCKRISWWQHCNLFQNSLILCTPLKSLILSQPTNYTCWFIQLSFHYRYIVSIKKDEKCNHRARDCNKNLRHIIRNIFFFQFLCCWARITFYFSFHNVQGLLSNLLSSLRPCFYALG